MHGAGDLAEFATSAVARKALATEGGVLSTDPTRVWRRAVDLRTIEHMFELSRDVATLDADRVRAWVRDVARSRAPGDNRSRLELVTALEELKCAAEGLQAEVAVDVDVSTREVESERGVPPERQGRGVAAELALARRESHHRGRQHLALAKVLHTELPFTREALRAGRITGWRATIIARETACLSRDDRIEIDRRVAGNAHELERKGDREVGDAVRRLAYELDAQSWVTRRRIAESERRVSLRPAPDVMSRLSAELPVAQGVAVIKTLQEHADSLRSGGDPRTRSQLMADALVSRILGTEQPTSVPVAIHVVLADDVLLGSREEAAHLDLYGPIPAELARELVKTASDEAIAQLRRLYVAPSTGALVAAESRSRRFPAGLATLITLRDQVCRTPWCDAPIRHSDHARSAGDGGETSQVNGDGLCEACNYAKQAHGWRVRPSHGDRHTFEITTPSGLTYRSAAPPPPRFRPDVVYPLVLAV